MEPKNEITEEIINEIFNRNIAMARDPIDGSLLSQEKVLEAMRAAIKESIELARSWNNVTAD